MFRQNFYPYRYNNYNSYNNVNYYNPNSNYANIEKKDTVSQENETIPFKDFQNDENNNSVNNNIKNDEINNAQSRKQSGFNILGFSFEIDDLIFIGLIILLFLESDKNYALIIILGLILLNVNLSDVLNIF